MAKKKKRGRKGGSKNAYPKPGSTSAAIVNELIRGNFVCLSDTAQELQCSVSHVLDAKNRWAVYITEQRELRKKTLREDEQSEDN